MERWGIKSSAQHVGIKQGAKHPMLRFIPYNPQALGLYCLCVEYTLLRTSVVLSPGDNTQFSTIVAYTLLLSIPTIWIVRLR